MKKLKLCQAEIDKLVIAGRTHSTPSVQGVGVVDVDFTVTINKRRVWQHQLWASMLMRCFCEKYKAKYPTYINVTCCDEWLSFGNFLEWVNKEVGYGGKPTGFHLDKDIICRGNKVYSPDTCCFVPEAVNFLLLDRINHRGEWPVGVHFDGVVGRFQCRISCDGVRKTLGVRDTPEEAFAVYKVAKEAQIKLVALRHKNVLKPAAFESLINWVVEPR